MDKIVRRLITSNLDGAKAITTTVTREDGTKAHYYIFKENNNDTKYVEIPLSVLLKENGKGRNRHYITVSVSDIGYAVHDLNKEHTVKPISSKTIGLPFDEAEELCEYPESVELEESDIFDNLSTQQIERCIQRLKWELKNKPAEEELNDPNYLPF